MYNLLTRQRRTAEILLALFVAWWAAGVLTDIQTGTHPLAWTKTAQDPRILCWLLLLGATFHAIGIRVNGKWKLSPVLRFIGMSISFYGFSFLAWHGIGTSAARTYSFISFLYAAGAVSAASDFAKLFWNCPKWKNWP